MNTTRTLLPLSAALLCAGSLVFGRSPESRPQEVEYALHPVEGPIHYVEGMGGNIGVMKLDIGLFVIDSQYARFRDQVLEQVEQVGEGGVKYLVNTHWHGDHVGNNGTLAGDGSILAHVNVRRRLMGDPGMEGRTADGTPPGDLPGLTYEDGVTLHLGGQTVEVVHVPAAHTDGDSIVFFPDSNVVHAGDVLFNGLFPFIDLSSGGSVDGLVAAVEGILERTDEDSKIIPGHGPLATRGDLETYRTMLQVCSGRVKEALAAGKSVDQMVSEDLLSDYASWSWSFIDSKAFLTALADDLGR